MGATASSKTEIGIKVARALGGEIVSVDSRQVFRHMDIGTAKPTAQDQARVKHHFIDVCEPDTPYNAGEYGRAARRCIEQMMLRGVVPVLVGGSGLYLRSILDGFFDESPGFHHLRAMLYKRLHAEGLPALYEKLRIIDPIGSERISPNDSQRVLRALEVGLSSGTTLTVLQHQQQADKIASTPLVFGINMPRRELYDRIDQRVDGMLKSGLEQEVSNLIALGYGRKTDAMGTMGYREFLGVLEGSCSLEIAVDLIKRRSRKYAKLQLTWFRKDRRIRWLDLSVWKINGVAERIVSHYTTQKGDLKLII